MIFLRALILKAGYGWGHHPCDYVNFRLILHEVNPAHGVALTYWQNLLKDHVVETDHNGYMLGVSYLAAALVVAACRRSSILRSWTSCLVILSILSMGLLLLLLTVSSTQVLFYLFLVAIQCVYEVSTSVSTFQVETV